MKPNNKNFTFADFIGLALLFVAFLNFNANTESANNINKMVYELREMRENDE